MSTAETVKAQLQADIAAANAATGKTDATMHDAVNSLIEGFGQGGGDNLPLLLSGTITQCRDATVTMFAHGYMFASCASLEEVDFPKLHGMRDYTFMGCSSLTKVNLPAVDYIGSDSFNNCAVETLSFPCVYGLQSSPSVQGAIYATAFSNCKNLAKVDFGFPVRLIRTNAFRGCSSLSVLVFRSEEVATLSNLNNFTDTPFAAGGAGGTIYVPAALISEYQNATNWSTLYAAGTCNFIAIEGSEYE